MATKPTETVAFEPANADVVAIPAPKQAVGFLPGEKPPAQYLSWLFRSFSRLYNYVLDGDLTGNHTVSGTLGVTGNVTVVNVDATTVRAATGVTGGTLASPARLDAPLGINITGGDLAHGERIYSIPAASFSVRTGNGGFSSVTVGGRTWDVLTFGTGYDGLLWAPLPFLRQGDRITEVGFRVLSATGTGGAGAISLDRTTHALGRVAAASAVTPLIPNNTVLGDSSSFRLSSLTVDVGSDAMFDVAISNADGINVAGLIGAVIRVIHP